MKKYNIFLIECGTLKQLAIRTIEADSLEEARRTGITRYSKPNCFVGASPV